MKHSLQDFLGLYNVTNYIKQQEFKQIEYYISFTGVKELVLISLQSNA